MGTSDAVAALALIVSLASAYISFRAFRHSVNVHEIDSSLAFDREKSELLVQVEQSRALFSAARREIERTQFVISQEPEQVQAALSCYDSLFTEFLPKLAGAERQASLLWDEIFNWRDKAGRSALAHHASRFRSLIEDDRVAHDSALFCNTEVRVQLVKAQEMNRNGKLA